MLDGSHLRRLAPTNASAQAILTGGYAWAVTIAPAALARGAPAAAKMLAAMSVIALGSFLAEARFGEWARRVGLWVFALGAAGVWWVAPDAVGSLRVDAVRGVAGMTGWALFALAVAAPGRQPGTPSNSPQERPRLAPRQPRAPGDAVFLSAGIVGAVALQLVGWRVASPERALLVRLMAVAGGIALVTTAANIALLRHKGRLAAQASPGSWRGALGALGLLFLLGLIAAVRACYTGQP
jgi:hypothetical protein